MSLADLEIGGLYAILFVRESPPLPNNFHWGLYLHRNDTAGNKYHVKQLGGGWIADHGTTGGVFKSFLLVGLFQIAKIPVGWEAHVDKTLRSYDDKLNTPGITCRVWMMWVLALLQKPANGYTVLKCQDLSALEQEIMAWGNANARGADLNDQPRPIGASKLCGL